MCMGTATFTTVLANENFLAFWYIKIMLKTVKSLLLKSGKIFFPYGKLKHSTASEFHNLLGKKIVKVCLFPFPLLEHDLCSFMSSPQFK